MSDITLVHVRKMLEWTSQQLLEHMTTNFCTGCPDCWQSLICQHYWMFKSYQMQAIETQQAELARLACQQEEEQA